jgi:hypothetical protein
VSFRKLTGTDGKPVFVNLGMIAHITAEIDDSYVPSRGVTGRSWIKFADLGSGISTLAVRETPSEILEGVLTT